MKFYNYKLHIGPIKLKVNMNCYVENSLNQGRPPGTSLCSLWVLQFSLYKLALRNVQHNLCALEPELLPWSISLGVHSVIHPCLTEIGVWVVCAVIPRPLQPQFPSCKMAALVHSAGIRGS